MLEREVLTSFKDKKHQSSFSQVYASQADKTGRGLDFILDSNRLNVAISRAQALAIVASSDRFMEIDFNSEQALRLAE